jgi:hypothetical protein
MCEHETCPYCLQIVTPVVQQSRVFTTKWCPKCSNVISDVARMPLDTFRRQARLAQEQQYLETAFEAESRGQIDAKNTILEWARERREAAEEPKQ